MILKNIIVFYYKHIKKNKNIFILIIVLIIKNFPNKLVIIMIFIINLKRKIHLDIIFKNKTKIKLFGLIIIYVFIHNKKINLFNSNLINYYSYSYSNK
jgi:hypothetical protein